MACAGGQAARRAAGGQAAPTNAPLSARLFDLVGAPDGLAGQLALLATRPEALRTHALDALGHRGCMRGRRCSLLLPSCGLHGCYLRRLGRVDGYEGLQGKVPPTCSCFWPATSFSSLWQGSALHKVGKQGDCTVNWFSWQMYVQTA